MLTTEILYKVFNLFEIQYALKAGGHGFDSWKVQIGFTLCVWTVVP